MQTTVRCERCRLLTGLCFCAEIPTLDTRTRVVLLMHAQEIVKPSNSGRLAHLCLPNSEIRLRGLPDRTPLDLSGLVDDTHDTWMLYLSDRSEALTPAIVERATKPVRLLVLDGNWSQASRLGAKLSRQLPQSVKHVKLTAGAPSEYQLRTEHHPDGLATFEAIARALGLLDGAHVQERMEKVFRVMRDRTLYTRGKISKLELAGAR